MPPLSMLIKPVSGNCNLRCEYCFYRKAHGIMTSDMLEVVVSKALNFADRFCVFAFQGGEPTLAGLSFYKHLIELQKKHNHKGLKINNAIQTNGIIIDDQWAEFLAENDFLVGLSLDGYMGLHDRSRRCPDGNGTFGRVMETVDIFNRANVQYNILAVVSEASARQAETNYTFFKDNGFKYLQFIPCLDPLVPAEESSLSSQAYLHFLKTTFDLWRDDIKNGNYISIRYFDNLLGMIMGYPPEACNMSGVCSCQFIIEADGSVYPCDFYVTDEWKIGNILKDNFDKMRFSRVCKNFIDISKKLYSECRSCQWYRLCRNGCMKERRIMDNMRGKYRFCDAVKSFYAYSLPGFIALAQIELTPIKSYTYSEST